MNRSIRMALLGAALLAGCHAHAYYYEPALPPPPPTEPPPGAPPPIATPSADDATASPPPTLAASVTPSSSAGPLPPVPSQAPRYAPTTPSEDAPSASEWVRSYPEGRWVYHATYGWIWIPEEATTATVEGVPYAYLYTPRFGWTWYVSPWGLGPYHYGVWVTHPTGWHHVWVAHPHIIIRLGRPRHHH